MARLDLHLHSTHSDGTREPRWVIEQATANGAELVALSDHDTLAGVQEARAAGRSNGVSVVAATEISVADPDLGELHVLGYLPASGPLGELERQLAHYRNERIGRAHRTINLLEELGVPVSEATVTRLAGDGAIGRPHIARALVEAGHVESVQEAFDRYLHNGGPAYVARAVLSMKDSIAMIHAAGGFASLAHPSRYEEPTSAIESFASAGGDGVEIYYRNDSPEIVAHGEQLARRLDLVPTVGSDFHGLHPDELLPATVDMPDAAADRLLAIIKDIAKEVAA